jgi:C-terminal processing protease CtpA/Prc
MKALLLVCAVLVLSGAAACADAPGPVVGIGTELKSEHGQPVVAQIVPGSPADQAGVWTGDRIVAVDHRMVAGLTLLQVAHLLHGARGSEVKITVNRGGGEKHFAMKREILFLAGAPQPNP